MSDDEILDRHDAARLVRAAVMIVSTRVHIEDRLAVLSRELADNHLEPFTRFLLYRALQSTESVGRRAAPCRAHADTARTVAGQEKSRNASAKPVAAMTAAGA